MKKPKADLSKVTRLRNGGVHAEYSIAVKEGHQTWVDKIGLDSAKNQHPDFDRAFVMLTPFISKLRGSTWIKALMESTQLTEQEQNAFTILSAIIKTGIKEQEDKIEVTSVTIRGREEKRQVILSAKIYNENKKTTAFNSPLIALNGTSFGFEVDLMHAIDVIIEETEDYLFNDKKAQLDLFETASMSSEQEEEPDDSESSEEDEIKKEFPNYSHVMSKVS